MKSMLYIGAVLMIGASIYGFVDYKKTSRSKEFKSLYHEEKKGPVLSKKVELSTLTKEDAPAEIKDIENNPSLKNQVSKKELAKEKTAESIKTKDENETGENRSDNVFESQKVKKSKKLNYKLFSRAPLREYSEEVVLPELKELKTEEVKPQNQ